MNSGCYDCPEVGSVPSPGRGPVSRAPNPKLVAPESALTSGCYRIPAGTFLTIAIRVEIEGQLLRLRARAMIW